MTRSRTPRRSGRFAGLLALGLLAGLTQLPASGSPAAPPTLDVDSIRTLGDPVAGLADLDTRGTAAPTAAQKNAADALGDVTVRWNSFGTPSSLLPADGSLGAAPGAPADGARTWLRQNSAVFGLSAAQVDGLELVNAQQLAGAGDGVRAILFRQKHGSLVPATGGMVTLGVAGGQVAYASSSLVRTSATPPAAVLTPLQGWLKAAANVGRVTDAATITDLVKGARPGDWTTFSVPGLAQQQQVRLRALALADGSVRPVLEANVVDSEAGDALAHTVLVDAVTGAVLVRRNQVDNESYQNVFTGSFTAIACGPKHAFELTDDATKSINALAAALPVDDVTVKLFDPSGALLVDQDLLTSPELMTYSADSIPAGTYTIQVCPFDAASAVVGQYTLGVYTSDQAAPSPADLQLNPRWRYFPANPTLDSPEQVPTNSVVGCWTSEAGCDTPPGALATSSAFGPWDTVLGGNVPTSTTIGNNANTHEAWVSPLTPGGLFQAPVSPTREYTAEFTDAWNNSKCDPTELHPGGNDIDASVANLFVAHNRMHDFSYQLGFTERNYNMQQENGGRGGVGGDPEVGNAQAGALTGGTPTYLGRDNANQITLQDGTPGITNQYLFQPIAGAFYAPCTDGGLDMGIVGHEYTHAISNRMVGGPDDGLSSEQGGAMGESWSDLVAAEYHYEHDYSNGGNVWAVGVYATGNKDVAIRDYSIDKNPLNYSDYGFDSTGPEVHADGEIWNGTQWEVRQALVEKYDAVYPSSDKTLQLSCAQSGVDPTRPMTPVAQCPGNRRWLQLMFDSFLLQQGATSMLDARDAMLAADQMRFAGADKAVMWQAFARRGMGRDAVTPDADSHEPTPSFAAAMTPNAPVTFQTGSPSKIYVGTYEARATPIADTIGDTPLGATAELTPGTYRMLAVSADRGFTRFTLTVDGAKARTVKVADELNVAGAAAGAKVIGATEGSLNAEQLIDGTEATNWGGVTEGNVDETNPSVSIDLAGDQQTVRRVQVSAMLNPAPADPNELPLLAVDDPDSGSRFTALRQFALEACTASCETPAATWTRFYTSPADAFPSVLPRPVAPDLTMREFDVPDTQAAAVRLVTLHNQCTGQAGYSGELDNDPTNDTDCKTASDRGTIVHASELQVFTTATKAPGGPGSQSPTTPPASDLSTPTASPTPSAGATTAAPTSGESTSTSRVETGLKVRLFRAVQTSRNAAPKLVARLVLPGEQAGVLGKFVVKLDGRTYRKADASSLRLTSLIKRRLAPGTHKLVVLFRPADRDAVEPARSRTLRITVR
ncbi:M36 family metallopeptidase [Nocardioides allogilvus]|uniref:M36 family metallopeptidase n=1 Tax=Nocardioides allogilvus TaxID=2072017 RepID=UPI000D309F20|nr:M36 family metallopeptidase [Nocardioides allogilvus]